MESLDDSAGLDFSNDAVGHSRTLAPRVAKQVGLPTAGGVVFPLKKHYDWVTFSFEGVSGSLPRVGVGFGLPDYDDDPIRVGAIPPSRVVRVGLIPRGVETACPLAKNRTIMALTPSAGGTPGISTGIA